MGPCSLPMIPKARADVHRCNSASQAHPLATFAHVPGRFMKPTLLLIAGSLSACLLLTASAFAGIFSQVHGVVHDPQHRPIPGARVEVHAAHADLARITTSDADGSFSIPALPLGDYTVTVSQTGFAPSRQAITLASDTSPLLHFELGVGSVQQSMVVTSSAETSNVNTVTPTALIDRLDIAQTPGADRTNSMAMITDYVPGAYMTHDMLHMRGGHQVSWLIDGVEIPNTNIAGNLAAQIDPKDIDYVEVQRGSYNADVGDRTYGVFNVVPRTGFERDRQAELVLTAGNFLGKPTTNSTSATTRKTSPTTPASTATAATMAWPRRSHRSSTTPPTATAASDPSSIQPHAPGSVPAHHPGARRLLPNSLRPQPQRLRKRSVRLQRSARRSA